MRNTVFLVLGFALLLVQANVFRVTSFVHFVLERLHVAVPFAAVTPSLVLPLIVFMGVHEYSLWRGAAIACVLGYATDLAAGAPIGLFGFLSVALFLLARAAGVRLAAQTVLTQIALAMGFALVEGVTVLILLAIFGRDPHAPREMLRLVPPHAVVTALVAPLVFRVAERAHAATIGNVPAAAGPER